MKNNSKIEMVSFKNWGEALKAIFPNMLYDDSIKNKFKKENENVKSSKNL